jgi:hypothetical protein
VKPDSDHPLPRSPEDSDNLRRLRDDGLRRLQEEERNFLPVYGGPPPAPVYGGPPAKGRWTPRRLLLILLGIIAALAALLFGTRAVIHPYPVYGGPPPPDPSQVNPQPVNPPTPSDGAPPPQPHN